MSALPLKADISLARSVCLLCVRRLLQMYFVVLPAGTELAFAHEVERRPIRLSGRAHDGATSHPRNRQNARRPRRLVIAANFFDDAEEAPHEQNQHYERK